MSDQTRPFEGLKPCPFCGEAPREKMYGEREDETGEVEGGFYEIACGTCTGGINTPVFCGVHAGGRAEAITAWNTRPTPVEEVNAELLDALQRALTESHAFGRYLSDEFEAQARTAISRALQLKADGEG